MLSFAQLKDRLEGLMENLDGELWTEILSQLNPPESFPKPETVHDMCFRDAKALAGYVPDLRAVIRKTSPKGLQIEEKKALISLKAIFNFAARLPVLILTIESYRDNQPLIDLYNGYRQTLKEIDDYLALANSGE
ncbi:MAG: hypothetical protein LBE31_09000 [Deltaproteobacteria bacterium]|jgi:hypothetical protein|nr:hypothetical protein [Deltaproteobacteria bacterium]